MNALPELSAGMSVCWKNKSKKP